MSFGNDITAAVGARQQVGTAHRIGAPATGDARTATPLSASASPRSTRLSNIFQDTFSNTFANVFQRGASGEFDDPTLRLAEQAALQRLADAQRTSGTTPTPTPTMTGANAAPTAAPPAAGASPTTTAPTSGTNASVGAHDGASLLAPTADPAIVTQQRELHDVRVQQAEARLTNLSSTLRRDFPLAVALPSATTGWDPETFVPKTREQAEAFAQRMVIDAAEAAARLEIVTNQREAARLEASLTGAPAATALVTKLDEEYARQQQYVVKLARIVDTSSGGSLLDAGAEALAGVTLRGTSDMSAREVAANLRASGLDEASIQRVLGAGEVAIEQAETPGGSERLRAISTATAEFTWTHRDNLRVARAREERISAETRRTEDRQRDYRRQDEKALEKRHERREQIKQTGEQRAAQHAQQREQTHAAAQQERAEFSRFLQQLATQS